MTTSTIKRGSAPLWRQISIMTWRNLVTVFRTPEAVYPSIFISVFFLFINQATFSEAAGFLPELAGKSYLGFILPFSIVSTALSGGGILAQNLVRDLESGYFDKLMLTPVSRAALLLGPIFAGAIILAIQAIMVMLLGFAMGLDPATGATGVIWMIVFSMLIGIAIGGFTMAAALWTNSAAATQAAGFIFFPLSFLTASSVPLELLSGWLKTAAQLNPITYVLEATRALMINGWDGQAVVEGLIACAIMTAITYSMALQALYKRTQRA